MLDILSFPALKDSHFALVDTDAKRLDYAKRIAERIVREGKFPATFEATADRREALAGADYVIIAILHGGIEVISQDIDIPMKYGVDQCIGDTLGPGGVFRALRTIPVMVDMARDVEELCPEALVLNYTNPMAMLCWSMYQMTDISLVGLCHSVQGTTRMLAKWAGVPPDEIDYYVAGINHQAWVLQIHHQGLDLYPEILRKLEDPACYKSQTTSCELCKHFDYFVTEGSGHNSEYVPWMRKRPDLRRKFCPDGSTWNGEPGFIKTLYGSDRAHWEADMEKIVTDPAPMVFDRSLEYGAHIINACETDVPLRFNGNVPNTGLITNLPEGCCVEVPCLADKSGLHPTFVGELPTQLAAINRTNINVQQLAVEAALRGDRRAAFHAVALDPLTAAVCSLDEIQAMVDEMFAAEAQWLPQFE
jgi:alpha-galactosidase